MKSRLLTIVALIVVVALVSGMARADDPKWVVRDVVYTGSDAVSARLFFINVFVGFSTLSVDELEKYTSPVFKPLSWGSSIAYDIEFGKKIADRWLLGLRYSRQILDSSRGAISFDYSLAGYSAVVRYLWTGDIYVGTACGVAKVDFVDGLTQGSEPAEYSGRGLLLGGFVGVRMHVVSRACLALEAQYETSWPGALEADGGTSAQNDGQRVLIDANGRELDARGASFAWRLGLMVTFG